MTEQELMDHADMALYFSKTIGKNKVSDYSKIKNEPGVQLNRTD